MDSSYPHDSTSITTSSNDENKKKYSTIIQSKRAEFFKTYQRQDFSLPDGVMFYITKNPSTFELYQKMIQTCKEFFVKNPILVISDLDYKDGEWFVNRKSLKMDNFTSQFWINFGFFVHPNDSFNAVKNIVSSITPKIFRCCAKRLNLWDQTISFNDLVLLISFAIEIKLTNVTVNDNYESIVEIEKIVKVAVKAKMIDIHKPPNASLTSKMMKELVEIPSFCELLYFSMDHIPETFDIEAFYVYMKKNKITRFNLGFDDSISEAYKNRLEEITNEILATKTFNYKPPEFRFPGLSVEKSFDFLCLA